ncbi:MAG: TolC family protein [Phycisphaerales bacterium]|nr:TolC family protein [Phycisphaerales bacterium]
MNDRLRLALSLSALALCAGCVRSPFATDPDELGTRYPLSRLRSIDNMEMSRYARGEASTPPTDVDTSQPPPDPFAGLDRYELSLEQTRAWTLENNLDLQTVLVDPSIAALDVSAEEARFESVFRTTARYSDFDQPTDSTLSGSQFNTLNITPEISIPLRTGGSISASLPINRSETDNVFSTLNPSFTSDLQFSISQPLLRNAGRRANIHPIRIAALGAQITEARTKLEVIRAVADADRAYWRLYAARRLLLVRKEQYDLAKAQLERVERRHEAGAEADVELIRAEAGLADRIEGIIIAANDVRARQRDLKRIMNADSLGPATEIELLPMTDPDPMFYELNRDALVADALAYRSEMLELELQLAQDASTIDFSRNQMLPSAALDYTYRVNGLGDSLTSSMGVLRENNFEDWSLGLTFETPIGNHAAHSRYHQAILRRLQRLSTREARKIAITQEVLNAADQLETTWQRIIAARQSVILQTRQYAAEQRQFELGRRTSTDVLDAAASLAQAQSAEISALTDYQIAQIDLAFATGTLLGAGKIDWQPRTTPEADHSYTDGQPRIGG